MTQTPDKEPEAPRAAFAIEGTVEQTPTRIAWGLGAGDLGLGALGLVTLLLAALGAPPVVVLVLDVVLAVLVALAVRGIVAEPVAGLGGIGRLLGLTGALVAALGSGPARWLPLVLLAAAVVGEVGYAQLVRVAVPFSSHLPGIDVRPS